MKILVTGVTGPLGRTLIHHAASGSHTMCGFSRRAPGSFPDSVSDWRPADLATGEGLAAALDGVDVVIHAASDPQRADLVDVEGAKRLIAAARDARISHIVYVSIVGVDRIPYAYYQKKLAAERITQASGIPFTILRATQFHSFIELLLKTVARTPLLLPLPARFHVQSVAISEVATRLLRAVDDGPSGRVLNFGGPEVLSLAEAARAWVRVTGRRKLIVPLPVPGKTGRAFRTGANTAPDGERGIITWQDWLTRRAMPHVPSV